MTSNLGLSQTDLRFLTDISRVQKGEQIQLNTAPGTDKNSKEKYYQVVSMALPSTGAKHQLASRMSAKELAGPTEEVLSRLEVTLSNSGLKRRTELVAKLPGILAGWKKIERSFCGTDAIPEEWLGVERHLQSLCTSNKAPDIAARMDKYQSLCEELEEKCEGLASWAVPMDGLKEHFYELCFDSDNAIDEITYEKANASYEEAFNKGAEDLFF